jgi:N-acyl-D-aspartate/D-glutamate deacylase
MQTTFLIKGGTVVDGTGAAPYQADVRVKHGIIAEIGQGLERELRERVVDASGCYVTPGFFESHNHFDGPVWWMPTLEPMPGYGVTTSINGNCGFTAAPVHDDPAVRAEMVRIFSFFEDIPEKPFMDLLPWDWSKWSEYRHSMENRVKVPVNYAAFVGHLAIRLAVMGMDAWERAATPEEIKKMCAHLDDALSAGAIGMSSNLLDHDDQDRQVPTWKADDAEWTALMDVIERHDGAVMQVIVDYIARFNAAEQIEKLAKLLRGRSIRIQIAGAVPTVHYAQPGFASAMSAFQALKEEGLDVWAGYHHRNATGMVSFTSSLMFAQSNNYAWGEIISTQGEEAKLAMLADPEWRARGRAGWDQTFPQSPLGQPSEIELFESETGAGPIGLTLRDYMDRTGVEHPSDALADWVIENGVGAILRMSNLPHYEDALLAMFNEPKALGNLSDSGAHGKMFCGVGDNVLLLTEYVRDRKILKIEEAINILSGRPAAHFNMHDRGELKVGKAADIVVFNLDEIEQRPDEKRWDVPDGEGGRTFRYSRKAAPMRLTLVNGVATFDLGDFTGNFPGRFIGPANEEFAEAAE